MDKPLVLIRKGSPTPAVEGGSKSLVLAWLDTQSDITDYEVRTHEGFYLSAVDFVKRHGKPVIPAYYQHLVPKYYQMDPEAEDLLPNGKELKNGMMVLIGNPDIRVRVDAHMSDWEAERAFERNQWCKVSNVEILHFRDGDHVVGFIGIYEDGYKRARSYSTKYPWLVKRNSIEQHMEKRETVRKLVMEAVNLRRSVIQDDEIEPGVEDITDKIIEVTS